MRPVTRGSLCRMSLEGRLLAGPNALVHPPWNLCFGRCSVISPLPAEVCSNLSNACQRRLRWLLIGITMVLHMCWFRTTLVLHRCGTGTALILHWYTLVPCQDLPGLARPYEAFAGKVRSCHILSSFVKPWQDLSGLVRHWQALIDIGLGKPCQAPSRLGRPWHILEVLGRPITALEGLGRLSQAL